ncbi:glucose-1-phosphate adenylyltransferase, partial [Chryseobacterium mucoviscidosis]
SFEEKPKYPKSDLASMGVYVFKWSVLEDALERDEKNSASSHDFGKDVIPALLEENKRLNAYPFKGYWKDVGTVRSLW